MKTLLIATLALTLGLTARAQFYAPRTEYHDISQRTFPVEAARILAWMHGSDAEAIAEIRFDVDTTAERQTVWSIEWFDAGGMPQRKRTVRYDESLLIQGPEYFRNVFLQDEAYSVGENAVATFPAKRGTRPRYGNPPERTPPRRSKRLSVCFYVPSQKVLATCHLPPQKPAD